MSIFSKAWRAVKTARHAVAVFADVGTVAITILGIASKPFRKAVEAARKVDEAADAIERAATKKDVDQGGTP